MSIFRKKDSSLLEGCLALSYLRDSFDEELLKLKAMEEMIGYAGIDGGIIFQDENVCPGIAYILEDIGRGIEGNLDKINSRVEAQVREAVEETKCKDPSLHSEYVRIPFYKAENPDKGDTSKPH